MGAAAPSRRLGRDSCAALLRRDVVRGLLLFGLRRLGLGIRRRVLVGALAIELGVLGCHHRSLLGGAAALEQKLLHPHQLLVRHLRLICSTTGAENCGASWSTRSATAQRLLDSSSMHWMFMRPSSVHRRERLFRGAPVSRRLAGLDLLCLRCELTVQRLQERQQHLRVFRSFRSPARPNIEVRRGRVGDRETDVVDRVARLAQTMLRVALGVRDFFKR